MCWKVGWNISLMFRLFLRQGISWSRNSKMFCFKGCYAINTITLGLYWMSRAHLPLSLLRLYLNFGFLFQSFPVLYCISSCMSYLSLCFCFDICLSFHVLKRFFSLCTSKNDCICLLLPFFLCSWCLSEEKSQNTERTLVYVKKLAWNLILGRTYAHADKQLLI